MRWATFSAAGKNRPARGAAVLLLVLALGVATAAPRPTATVSGHVVDGDAWQPLAGVTIVWDKQRAVTGADGAYQLRLPAGVRTLTFSAPGRAAARKLVVIRDPGKAVRLDAVMPAGGPAPVLRLAMNRGLYLSPEGKVLPTDAKPAGTLTLADAFGNQDRPLRLNLRGFNAWAPTWAPGGQAVYYGVDGTFHKPADRKYLGVFRHEPATGRTEAVLRGHGIRHIARNADGTSLAVAGEKSLYVLDAAARPNPSPRPAFSLGNARGWLLSVAWGPADWIYFTVDDQIPLDERRYASRPRIARMHSDGSGLEPRWAAAEQSACRYPLALTDGAVLYGRHSLDGTAQEVWLRPAAEESERKLADTALRPIWLDAVAHRLYYIYMLDLHVRDLRTGADLVIVQSAVQADYRRD